MICVTPVGLANNDPKYAVPFTINGIATTNNYYLGSDNRDDRLYYAKGYFKSGDVITIPAIKDSVYKSMILI